MAGTSRKKSILARVVTLGNFGVADDVPVSEEEIIAVLEECGDIESVQIWFSKNKNTRFAFVTFEDQKSAQNATARFSRQTLRHYRVGSRRVYWPRPLWVFPPAPSAIAKYYVWPTSSGANTYSSHPVAPSRSYPSIPINDGESYEHTRNQGNSPEPYWSASGTGASIAKSPPRGPRAALLHRLSPGSSGFGFSSTGDQDEAEDTRPYSPPVDPFIQETTDAQTGDAWTSPPRESPASTVTTSDALSGFSIRGVAGTTTKQEDPVVIQDRTAELTQELSEAWERLTAAQLERDRQAGKLQSLGEAVTEARRSFGLAQAEREEQTKSFKFLQASLERETARRQKAESDLVEAEERRRALKRKLEDVEELQSVEIARVRKGYEEKKNLMKDQMDEMVHKHALELERLERAKVDEREARERRSRDEYRDSSRRHSQTSPPSPDDRARDRIRNLEKRLAHVEDVTLRNTEAELTRNISWRRELQDKLRQEQEKNEALAKRNKTLEVVPGFVEAAFQMDMLIKQIAGGENLGHHG